MLCVREAVSQDFHSICELMKNELGYPDLDEADALKRLEYFSGSDDWETFVAVLDDEIVGFIGVKRILAYNIKGYNAEIMALAVSEKTRQHGIGTALIRKAEEWALSHDIAKICLHSNMRRLGAHAFYEKNGYEKASLWFVKPL